MHAWASRFFVGLKDVHPHRLLLIHRWSVTMWPFGFWNSLLLPWRAWDLVVLRKHEDLEPASAVSDHCRVSGCSPSLAQDKSEGPCGSQSSLGWAVAEVFVRPAPQLTFSFPAPGSFPAPHRHGCLQGLPSQTVPGEQWHLCILKTFLNTLITLNETNVSEKSWKCHF